MRKIDEILNRNTRLATEAYRFTYGVWPQDGQDFPTARIRCDKIADLLASGRIKIRRTDEES